MVHAGDVYFRPPKQVLTHSVTVGVSDKGSIAGPTQVNINQNIIQRLGRLKHAAL
jgi:hypothetical protein